MSLTLLIIPQAQHIHCTCIFIPSFSDIKMKLFMLLACLPFVFSMPEKRLFLDSIVSGCK